MIPLSPWRGRVSVQANVWQKQRRWLSQKYLLRFNYFGGGGFLWTPADRFISVTSWGERHAPDEDLWGSSSWHKASLYMLTVMRVVDDETY
jgi:hypothetical protein